MNGTIARNGSHWAFAPVILLVVLCGIQLVLVKRALSDPSFAVEDGYYSKAVSWDARKAQEAENARLGWHTEATLVAAGERSTEGQVALVGRAGEPVRGAQVELRAFAVARSSQVIRVVLRETSPGVYRGTLPAARHGWWELEVSAVRGSERFTSTLRRELVPGGAS